MGGGVRVLIVALASAAAMLAAAPARAHEVPGLGEAHQLAGGLYQVQLRTGLTLTTHGADGPDAGELAPVAPPRPPRCADTPHVRVLYGRPALGLGAPAVPRTQIEETVWRANGAFDRAALESGGRHADLRVRCAADGTLQIDTFVNAFGAGFADVVDAARLAGATDPAADYLVFYDDPSPDACGVGSFSDDDRPGADNANNAGGGYAVVYADCWDDATALHEIGHTQGAVQPSSPYGTGHGHCRDEADVMCYEDGAGGMLDLCSEQQFDCGYDDYFDAATEPGEYLETRWNLGSAANAFLEFSDLQPGEEAATDGCTLAPLWMAPDVCVATEEPGATAPPIRIRRFARRHPRGVRVGLRCPATRDSACRGRLRVRGGSASRPVRLAPGRRRDVTVPLRGRARRLRVVVHEPALATRTRRTVIVRE